MRLLHFLPVYAPAWQFGGPVLSVSRLCEGLAAAGAEVEVMAGQPNGVNINEGCGSEHPEKLMEVMMNCSKVLVQRRLLGGAKVYQ